MYSSNILYLKKADLASRYIVMKTISAVCSAFQKSFEFFIFADQISLDPTCNSTGSRLQLVLSSSFVLTSYFVRFLLPGSAIVLTKINCEENDKDLLLFLFKVKVAE